eukprot:scaffold3221_cov126-Skeletonema_marinoi.AAC.27
MSIKRQHTRLYGAFPSSGAVRTVAPIIALPDKHNTHRDRALLSTERFQKTKCVKSCCVGRGGRRDPLGIKMQTMNVKERRREHSQHSQSPYITKYREVSQYQVSVWVKVRSPGGRPAAVKFVKVPPDKYLLT